MLVSLKTSSYFGLREDKFVFGEKSYYFSYVGERMSYGPAWIIEFFDLRSSIFDLR